MHELAIAGAVLDVALDHARGRRVTRIHIRVGYLRQVVPTALRFAFELIAQGTLAEDAELDIEPVPAAGRCETCGARSALPSFPFQCENCGALDVRPDQGEELEIEWLETG